MEKYLDTSKDVKVATAPAGGAHSLRHTHKAYWLIAVLAALLIIWLIWHKPLSRAWDALLGKTPTVQNAALGNATLPAGGTTATIGATEGTSTNKANTTDAKSSTTTTTTTTNTDPNPTPAPTGGLLNLFADITPGLTLDQVTGLAGVQPSSCTTITIPLVGDQSVCTFTQDGQSVVATLLNGRVTSKAKLGF